MSNLLAHNAYGKSKVRLTKIIRHPDWHDIKELSVDIQLEGDFEGTYLSGDNSNVVATDSMKNTVYVLASEHPFEAIEDFGTSLASHFLKHYQQVKAVKISIAEDLWQRIVTGGEEHRTSFVSGGNEKRSAVLRADRNSHRIQSGCNNLLVLKTTDSEFCGFVRDRYTTLPEVRDRIFATTIEALWLYRDLVVDFNRTHAAVRQTLLDVFANHHSLSVQQTLYAMGEAVLAAYEEIEEITLVMPNQHRIPFDMSSFGGKNGNEIFVPINEPYGLISGTIRRDDKDGEISLLS